MRGIACALGVAIVMMLASGCAQNAAERMKRLTDIDLTKQPTSVSFVDRKDLDQVGYDVKVDELRERGFLDEIEKVSGKMCMGFVSDGEGCHYRSKLGHDVFITKTGTHSYRIYTSG
jgi:hypothetical protein